MIYSKGMKRLLFGTAGIPLSSPDPSTSGGIRYLKQIGLDAMEIEFVRQIYLTDQTAPDVAESARKTGIKLSAHAPYFINLNALEPQKRRISQSAILKAAKIAALTGASELVFHPGYYMESSPGEAIDTMIKYLEEIEEKLSGEALNIRLRPETTGKLSQFGRIEEITPLCHRLKNALPCIDFAHMHALTGAFNTYEEFMQLIERTRSSFGAEHPFHIHVSGIKYGPRGEISHLPLDESDFNYRQLLRALSDSAAQGTVICESPLMEQDGLKLKEAYYNYK